MALCSVKALAAVRFHVEAVSSSVALEASAVAQIAPVSIRSDLWLCGPGGGNIK